jgi:hypothetical protein
MRSVLASQFVHIPHDVVVPGALTAGDIPDLVAWLEPLPVRVEGMVDGTNRRVSDQVLQREWGSALRQHPGAVALADPTDEAMGWLVSRLLREL